MRKVKLKSEVVRNMSTAQLGSVRGGANAEPVCSAGPYKDSCFPDIPPRLK